MKKTSFISALSIGVLSISMAFASPADAVNQVRENSVQVRKILNSGDANTARQKAVGNPWRTATDAQKQALTKEFQTLLIRTYSGTMLKFKNAKVNIKDNPIVNKGGKEIVVRAEINVSGQKPVNMDFTTYQSGSRYRAYNVAVEGASLVTVYRNQFGETIKAKGIDGLIADLKAKNGGK